ncbi:MAG: hypothetical protein IPK79_05440 [Vampirovibrionales bacterium]|nr:hypothetical protein [Vampirovibrionales bacterium]
MTSLSTEEFPYTLTYVRQMLNVEESELMALVKALSLAPKSDETNRVIFSHRDTEVLRKALDMRRRGEDLQTIVRYFAMSQASAQHAQDAGASMPSPPTPATQMRAPAPAAAGGAEAMTLRSIGKESLAVVVEAVSTAKEGILRDMSRLLDDKLTGLDEVVVELIRCKSENDALRQKLKEKSEETDALQYELTRYKSSGFGFYRKI